MAKQFLDKTGAATFLAQLKGLFATKAAVTELKTNTDPYIFDIDYSVLEFDTDFIITGEVTSPVIGIGQVGFLIIAES